MAWIRKKQCLNCNEIYGVDYAICPHCNIECKDSYQNKYGETTVGYKSVEFRIPNQKEREKIHRMKRIKYDERGFNPRTGLHRNGTRYDDEGYDIEGYDEEGLDRDGYNRRGFDPKTRLHRNGTYYDDKGYDGYNEYGYDPQGHPRGRNPLKEAEKEKARIKRIKETLG